MTTATKKWELCAKYHPAEWIDIISRGDAGAMWAKLFHIITRHSAVRSLYASKSWSQDNFQDMCCDLTQDLFLRLQEKDRWKFYIQAGYTDERVEQELYGIEVPNLISQLLREHYPESYRIARRTSNLLLTQKEFRRFNRSTCLSGNTTTWSHSGTKMVKQIFGLATWPSDKPITHQQQLHEMINTVGHRMRNTRRTGRGNISQVVISNVELIQLIIDIFNTINTPTDVRTMRSLVLSKLTIEDSRIVPMDEVVVTPNPDKAPIKIDFADNKPTPEEIMLEKETATSMEWLADDILLRCLERVRNKSQRFRKLVEIVWHCYFNQASTSQTNIARLMDISDSLVSHYRKIFDTIIRGEDLTLDEWIYLNNALDGRLNEIVARYRAGDNESVDFRKTALSQQSPVCKSPQKYLVASALQR